MLIADHLCLRYMQSGKARVTAVARSNYTLYTTSGVTLYTERFGEINNWKPYRGRLWTINLRLPEAMDS